MSDESPSSVKVYGTPVHAAVEALTQSSIGYDGYVSADVQSVAEIVVAGLRERGFTVTNEPRCECGWTGYPYNHNHDSRMGRSSEGDKS